MYEEEKEKILSLEARISESLKAINLDEKRQDLGGLQQQMADPNFFQDLKKMKTISRRAKAIENILEPWEKLKLSVDDLCELLKLGVEEREPGLEDELNKEAERLTKVFARAEKRRLLHKEDDGNNAIVTIQAGAGGTESCDWTAMLFRMYVKYAEKNNMKITVLEEQLGEEAGIRNATLLISGANATGLLRSENGVHRLVRISPFDSAKRRHTSFASVSVIPEIDDDIEVVIDSAQLRIDTYRASGAGGQHVNTTDSAVRITHLPTGIVVSCQAERSQLQNKDKAMKTLRAKIYEHEKLQRETAKKEVDAEKKKIEWGSQIRSYVFHPYSMVKDHRTSVEVGDVQSVMDGVLDVFVTAYLEKRQFEK